MVTTDMVVLCIDNDPEDIEFFCDAANAVVPSINALSALSGREALDLLSSMTTDELPAYIFLDINMPQMNGKETLQEIRKTDRYSSVQVVMLSTGLDPKSHDEYKVLGASHFLPKANSLKEFCDKLTDLFNSSVDK